jgi:hypothetical protein
MRARSASLVAVSMVVALGVMAFGQDSPGAMKKIRKPQKVDLVSSVPLSVSVTNTPTVTFSTATPLDVNVVTLPGVTVSSMPPVNLGTVPPIGVSSLPPVAVATLPAVDVGSLPATTHNLQKVGDLVVLSLINPTTTPVFVRSHDDGATDTAEFVIPADQKLVITEVDWVATSADNSNVLRLFIENISTTSRALVQTSPGQLTLDATAVGSTNLTTGFVVGTNNRILTDVRPAASAISAGTTIGTFTDANVSVILRGYLTKAP